MSKDLLFAHGLFRKPRLRFWDRAPDAGNSGQIMAELAGLMRGKRGLILGVANNRSLAWGIARACRAQGPRSA